jgi:hypothetical protein
MTFLFSLFNTRLSAILIPIDTIMNMTAQVSFALSRLPFAPGEDYALSPIFSYPEFVSEIPKMLNKISEPHLNSYN